MKAFMYFYRQKQIRLTCLTIGITIFVYLSLLTISCDNNKTVLQLFHEDGIYLARMNRPYEINGYIEDIYCNGSLLITYNLDLDYSYTLYDLRTGQVLNRFGMIGHGYNEIPSGCFGGIFGNEFMVFKDANKLIAKYTLSNENTRLIADTIIHYSLDESMLSSVVPVGLSTYLGIGAYNWNEHYVLFDTKGHIYDSASPLYNANDSYYNDFTKFLSNQGLIIRHPRDNKYVGTTNNSSIIDFMRITDNRIEVIKRYEHILPSWEVLQSNNMNKVVWTTETINGFLDLSGNEKFVFALYSEDTMEDKPYVSNDILVFDWEGNPKHRIKMKEDVQQITVNDSILLTLSEDGKGEQHIYAYKIDF